MKNTPLALLTVAMLIATAKAAMAQDSQPADRGVTDPPAGFVSLFNGKDLTGWKGLVGNPKSRSAMSPEQLVAAQAKADEAMRSHWKAVDGVLEFDGHGSHLCTARDYGDFELLVDWKISPRGDSGIYLRGSPQVQIWDPGQWKTGSGGLYNNQKNPSKPTAVADRPIGQWNTFRIRMVGPRVSVWLNEQLVVDNVMMENYWERGKPIYPRGQIELQSHGSKLYFRNIFIRELDAPAASQPAGRDDRAAEQLGWRLAVQTYSFRQFTFFEAVDKAASIGVRYIEAYPGQRLSKDGGKFDQNMTDEQIAAVQKKLRDSGVTLVNYGVIGLGNGEAAHRKVFEFARRMGIETLVTESYDSTALDDKLCQEYGVNIALHNHPGRKPETVLVAAKDRSKRIGACADTGHWMRTDIKPLAGLQLLQGRIISLHFKDLNSLGRSAHDVVWGTGQADAKALLAELKRQNFRGVFSIEYEYNWSNSLPEIAQCVQAFDRMAGELLAESQADKAKTK